MSIKFCYGLIFAMFFDHANGICIICNSHATDFPPIRGDNPRALASGLSPVQGENMV